MHRLGGTVGRARRFARPHLLLAVPAAFGAAAFLAFLASDARLTTTSVAAFSPAAPTPAIAAPTAPTAPARAIGSSPAAPAATPAAAPTPTAPVAPSLPASPSRSGADTTLPANPALRSLEARVRFGEDAVLRFVAGAVEPAPAGAIGHSGATSPDLLPDLRPLRQARPAADEPGNPFFVPDPINPIFKNVQGPFRPNLPDRDQSKDRTPNYTEGERKQLVAEGKDLFFSTTAFGQRPSEGPNVSGEFLSCATCHSGQGFSDGRTHIVGPVREREIGHRQTPGLFGVANTAPFGWDGRNPALQDQARGAIVSPLEMHSSREPTKRELDALAEFQKSIVEPAAIPGKEFDPVMAKRGEVLFRTPRPVIDPSGEFASGQKIACATCHAGPFFTDGKAHRIALPTFFFGDPLLDPGQIGSDGNIQGFNTPSLLGARFTAPFFHDGVAGDPTAPSNLLGGGLGVGALDGDVGASGAPAARRALLNNVLPFYNSIRFNFGFTQDELKDLAEFVLSL
jgi:hypothetical protein